MHKSESVLHLKEYFVNEMSYKVNEKFDFTKITEVNLKPKFTKFIKKIDNNNFMAYLKIDIFDNEEIVPFLLNITISGLFNLENWENEENKTIAEMNTIAILFPYLRTLVTFATSNGGMNPYILPVLNINALFEKKEK